MRLKHVGFAVNPKRGEQVLQCIAISKKRPKSCSGSRISVGIIPETRPDDYYFCAYFSNSRTADAVSATILRYIRLFRGSGKADHGSFFLLLTCWYFIGFEIKGECGDRRRRTRNGRQIRS